MNSSEGKWDKASLSCHEVRLACIMHHRVIMNDDDEWGSGSSWDERHDGCDITMMRVGWGWPRWGWRYYTNSVKVNPNRGLKPPDSPPLKRFLLSLLLLWNSLRQPPLAPPPISQHRTSIKHYAISCWISEMLHSPMASKHKDSK